jgi:hypothetical protein
LLICEDESYVIYHAFCHINEECMYNTEVELIAAFDTFENGCLSVCEFYDMFCDLTGICPEFEGECDQDGY